MVVSRKPMPKVVKKARGTATRLPARRGGNPTITSDVTRAAVDAVPPTGYATSARAMRYANVLADVRAKVGAGRPVPIATFANRGTATQVKQALEAGERQVDGKVGDWVFDARRTDDGGSVLYATLKPVKSK